MGAGAGTDRLVVHVSALYPPHLGGTEQVVERLVEQRIARGLPVQVVTSRLGLGPRPDDSHDDPPVHRLRARAVAHTPVMPGLAHALWRLPADSLLHVHVAQAFTPEVTSVVARLQHRPLVVHLHLDAPPSGPAGVLLRAYKPLVLARVLRRAAAVIVFTESQRREVARTYRVTPERIHVVPNGVDARYFATAVPARHDPVRLLFVGRLGPAKQVGVLLDALDGISDRFTLEVVGDGELRAVLERRASELRPQCVRFYGRLDGEALHERLRAADVFVLPSAREGMPLALLEALASGLPAVVSDIPGVSELVRTGVNGIVVPSGDASALGAALRSMTGPEEGWATLARNASEGVRHLSWEAVADAVETVYAGI